MNKQPSANEAPVKTTPLSERDHELMGMPTIASQLPVVFDNKGTWDEFDGKCCGCGKTLDREHVRGLIARPIPSVATVEAVGACEDCRLLSRFEYRMHDDHRFSGRTAQGWRVWQARRPTLWSWFQDILRTTFGQKRS